MSRNLSTFRQFANENRAFPESSTRWLAFHSETNGFKRAFPKIGRRRLIDVDVFFDVIAEQNGCTGDEQV